MLVHAIYLVNAINTSIAEFCMGSLLYTPESGINMPPDFTLFHPGYR